MQQEHGSKVVPSDDPERRPTDNNKAKDIGRNAKLPMSEHCVLQLFIESESESVVVERL